MGETECAVSEIMLLHSSEVTMGTSSTVSPFCASMFIRQEARSATLASCKSPRMTHFSQVVERDQPFCSYVTTFK